MAVNRRYETVAPKKPETLGVLEVDLTDIEELVAAMSKTDGRKIIISFAGGTVDEPEDLKDLHPRERRLLIFAASKGIVALSPHATRVDGEPELRQVVKNWAEIRRVGRLHPRVRIWFWLNFASVTFALSFIAWAIGSGMDRAFYWPMLILLAMSTLTLALLYYVPRMRDGSARIHFTGRQERLAANAGWKIERAKIALSILMPIAAVLLGYLLGLKK